MTSRLAKLVRSFGHPRILIVGDLVLDQSLWCQRARVWPREPLSVLRVDREDLSAGAGGRIATRLMELGALVEVAGAVGLDPAGDRVLEFLGSQAIEHRAIVRLPDRPTPQAIRVITSAEEKLQPASRPCQKMSPAAEKSLIENFRSSIRSANLVIVCDYDRGTLSDEVLRAVVGFSRSAGVPVVACSAGGDCSKFAGCKGIVPTLPGLSRATRRPAGTREEIRVACEQLLRDVRCEFVLVLHEDAGLSLFCSGRHPEDYPVRAKLMFDEAGAADSTISAVLLALACEASPADASALGVVAGSTLAGRGAEGELSRQVILEELERAQA